MLNAKVSTLYIPVFVFLLASCNAENRPEYINQLPDVESFIYTPVSEEHLNEVRTSVTPELLISGSEEIENFIGTPFWIEKVNDEIWIADPVKGEVVAFEKGGGFSRKIATKGGGPGELQHPASIYYNNDNPSLADGIWVLDSGIKGIIRFSHDGQEVRRFLSEHILSEFFGNRLLVSHENTFIVPLMNHEKHVLGIIDQNGDLIDSFVDRIVPIGYQPVTHNRVQFDFDSNRNLLAYAYIGMPLIFLERPAQNGKAVYNFWPERELKEFNLDLTPLPKNIRASVSWVSRDLFIDKNEIYFRLQNEIVILDFESGRVEHVISLVDNDGFSMVFQQMIYSDGIFFLVNRFSSDIYYFRRDGISN